ncbi:MAG: hypothetical protein AAF196_17995 [Planctomycetota bacterium]
MMHHDDGSEFHYPMAGLLLLAVVVENFADKILPGFAPPQVGLLTLAAVAVWLGRTVLWQGDRSAAQRRQLESRIEELEHKSAQLERELAARRAPFDPGRRSD